MKLYSEDILTNFATKLVMLYWMLKGYPKEIFKTFVPWEDEIKIVNN